MNRSLVIEPLLSRIHFEAKTIYREEWKLCEKKLGRDHPSTLDSINNLGLVLHHQGKDSEAEQVRQEWKERLARLVRNK
jgi:hypothetical protein